MSAYPEPGRVASGVLAIVVHVLFIALLVFGLSWQRRPPPPLVAELWRELPSKVDQPAKPSEPPPPPPAPKLEAPPPKPEPKVEQPRPEPAPQPPKADIELKEKQRKLREQKAEEAREAELKRRQAELERRQEAERRKEEAARKKEEERKEAEARRRQQEEQQRQEEARRREEEQRLEDARREEERKLEREADARRSAILDEQEKLAQEARRRADEEAKKRAAQLAAAARQRQLDQYIAGIKQKIRNRLVLPPGMNGNPQVLVSVTLLPGGEVLDVRLVKSSGVPAYDAAVERAIHAAEPLPVPSDTDMFQQLRQANYAFRPLE